MTEETNIDPVIYDLFEFKPRKGDLKKLEITKAAINSIAEDGFENTTYDSIANRIGTRRAHVAYHFASKKEIYKNAIKYILSTAQTLSIEHISKAKNGKEMLNHYIEATFIWAEENPNQLSVMLLLYYLCTVDKEYIELHDQVRRGGADRIHYILTTKLGRRFTPQKAELISKSIQSLITGEMIDACTTKNKSLKDAKKSTLKAVQLLLN